MTYFIAFISLILACIGYYKKRKLYHERKRLRKIREAEEAERNKPPRGPNDDLFDDID